MAEADIGLIGLAVMGQNLALNMNDHGYRVAVFNRTVSKVDNFLEGPAKGSNIIGTHSLEEFIRHLKTPRRIMLMVKAGKPVDVFIEQSLQFVQPGDLIIDGGNSYFMDTIRRCRDLREKGILFIGTGISGGEEGARHGPSIMPGGNPDGWPLVKEILQNIAAKVADGTPCCDWVGQDGAGHYVKMVHNGIEYGDMQLICEAYHLMKEGLGLEAETLRKIFKEWNRGELDSYLIEITSHIFMQKDDDGTPILDKILDVAGQKGTGKWTVSNALDLEIPLSLISEAVFSRFLSSLKAERKIASTHLHGPNLKADISTEDIRQALYASKIISYGQGFMLMQQASQEYRWDLDYGKIAMMWREGCIIRSRFLENIKDAYSKRSTLQNLLFDEFFQDALQKSQQGWRNVVAKAAEIGIPTPCFSSALTFYDSFRSARLPANLLQAQRDYFGAHTYERIDQPRGKFFHTEWSKTD